MNQKNSRKNLLAKNLREKLKNLPSASGVYFYKNSRGEIIYVGKAANLKNRVRSYFNREHSDQKTRALVREIVDANWIVTDTEIDALFLESEMIKRYKPAFNILLRDDKTAIFVRINLREKIPFVDFTRQPLPDGAKYFGPFYSASAIKKALRILRKIFPYFSHDVTKSFAKRRSKLNQQIGVEPDISTENARQNYKKDLRNLISYIKGNRVKIMREIEAEMRAAAVARNFEIAAKKRNQLRDLGELKQQIVFGREEFLDISKDFALQELRNLLNLPEIPRRIEAFDISHISGENVTASMVVATNGVADKREYRKFRLKNGADDGANLHSVVSRRLKHLSDWGRPDLIILDGGTQQIGAVFDLLFREKISFVGRNKSGDHSGNAPTKLIVPEIYFAKEKSEFCAPSSPKDSKENSTKSDKIFAKKVTKHNPEKTNKNPDYSEINPTKEAFVTREIFLKNSDHVAKLIARLDEEAHRFAITYHQNLRGKKQTKNALEEIPGVGAKTRAKLLKKFGSVQKIRVAKKSEIAQIVGEKLAQRIKQNL